MNKTSLIDILDSLLLPHSFKRKGNYWVNNEGEVAKMVHLQKSNFSDQYYVNHGFIIKALPLGELSMHLYKRYSPLTLDPEKASISNLGERSLSDQQYQNLVTQIEANVVKPLLSVRTESDLKAYVLMQEPLGTVPVVVLDYFEIRRSSRADSD